jgi:CheY-like chemotaxis protein
VEAIGKSRSLSHELSPPGLAHNDLHETFEWLAGQVKAKHGLTVHLDVRDRVELTSEPLKILLYRAAQEMLFNVIKHAGVREAKLRLRRRGGAVCLSVSDQGQGFAVEEPGPAGGLGLGSIRERVKLLGGRMKVRSLPGKGSTFRIVVPDARPPVTGAQDVTMEKAVPGATAMEKRQTGPGEQVLRVLLADDHKIVREGIESMLVGEPDIEIVGQAGNGREAVDLACRLEPDVVVMDVSMPVMSGDEATRQIKRHRPQTRVIALSMHDEAQVSNRMRRAGAAAYLSKTAPSEELLAAIRGN